MSHNSNSRAKTVGSSYDQGLRQYMMSVYNYMAGGLGLTGIVAYLVGSTPTLQRIFLTSPMIYVAMFAPLAIVFFMSFKVQSMSLKTLQTTFWVYAGTMGVSMASIFLVYTTTSIVRTFFVTASMFLAMSIYGYTTKKDLSGMGSFLMMGLFGIVIASVVNIFLKSSGLEFAVSILGVLIFTGLTAYDTQKIRNYYSMNNGDSESMGKSAVMGALSLYLDFINLFIMLLRLMGDRK